MSKKSYLCIFILISKWPVLEPVLFIVPWLFYYTPGLGVTKPLTPPITRPLVTKFTVSCKILKLKLNSWKHKSEGDILPNRKHIIILDNNDNIQICDMFM